MSKRPGRRTRWVAVGAAVAHHDRGALRDLHAAHRGRAGGLRHNPWTGLSKRRASSMKFFISSGSSLQPGHLVGVLDEQQHAGGQRPGRGLEARR